MPTNLQPTAGGPCEWMNFRFFFFQITKWKKNMETRRASADQLKWKMKHTRKQKKKKRNKQISEEEIQKSHKTYYLITAMVGWEWDRWCFI